jgi:hypothetical protein
MARESASSWPRRTDELSVNEVERDGGARSLAEEAERTGNGKSPRTMHEELVYIG